MSITQVQMLDIMDAVDVVSTMLDGATVWMEDMIVYAEVSELCAYEERVMRKLSDVVYVSDDGHCLGCYVGDVVVLIKERMN